MSLPRWLWPHRYLLYLTVALGLLSVPAVVGYVRSAPLLTALGVALAVLTLVVYAEIFNAAERGSIRYRKMTGQPDLLTLADTQPIHNRAEVWQFLTGGARWLTLLALAVGRLAFALAASHYLHIYIPNSALRIFGYVSHNGYFELWWPVWWQMALAAGVLIAFTWAEAALMVAWASLLYGRIRLRGRLRFGLFIGGRTALGILALAAVGFGYTITDWVLNLGPYPRARMFMLDACYVGGDYMVLAAALTDELCDEIAAKHAVRRTAETVQIGLFSLFDGGTMAASSLMRPQQTYRFRGEGLSARPQLITPSGGSFGRPIVTYWLISPWRLILRVLLAVVLGLLAMRFMTWALWRAGGQRGMV
ncbi:MAG: hypothetical protein MUF38_09835 [Anaerolineae bacterium]|jgi:hypothetical protein|nr:hypothetical protein [Anaerolineae bacterium]